MEEMNRNNKKENVVTVTMFQVKANKAKMHKSKEI
jgi:hypothetical protein